MNDDLDLATPNCRTCLEPLEIHGSDPEQPYWACRNCGSAAIALSY